MHWEVLYNIFILLWPLLIESPLLKNKTNLSLAGAFRIWIYYKGKITEDYEVLFPLPKPQLAILGHFDINSIFSLFQITFPHLLHVI